MSKFRRQRSLSDTHKFHFIDGKLAVQPSALATSVIVVGQSGEEGAAKKLLSDFSLLRSAHEYSQKFYGFEGKYAQLALASGENTCLFVGLGKKPDFYARKLLHLGGKIGQATKKLKNGKLIFLVDSFFVDLKSAKKDEQPQDFAKRSFLERNLMREEALERLLTGYLMAIYEIPNPKHEDKGAGKKKTNDVEIHLASKMINKDKLMAIAAKALRKAEATYWVRDECSLPPNVLVPEIFAKDIRELGEKSGFKTKILDEEKIQKEGFGGVWAVGKGSINPPRLVIAEYNASAKGPHLVLIGKGVTFDTGGISIKPALNMHEMKEDMTGAAVLSATLGFIAQEKLPLRVTALFPLVENRPSHNSLLPGDVFTAWGGSTVEVQNTDAEGRLILCDCLAYAQALKADLVVDMATLTGAASVTLGPPAILFYGNEGAWIEKFIQAARHAGEECWEMPLFDEYAEDLKSSVAHLRNHVGHRDGNSHVAAQFLNYFVDDKYPWLHLDIAAYTSTKWKGAHCPSEAPTGLPLLAMVELAEQIAKKKN